MQKVIIKLFVPEVTSASYIAPVLALLNLFIYLLTSYVESVKLTCLILNFSEFNFLAALL